jgi:hypothetical protein
LPSYPFIHVNVTYPLLLTLCSGRTWGGSGHIRKRDEE